MNGCFQNVFDREMVCVYWPWAAVLRSVSDAAEYGGALCICAVLDLVQIIHIQKHHANHINLIAWLLQNRTEQFQFQLRFCYVEFASLYVCFHRVFWFPYIADFSLGERIADWGSRLWAMILNGESRHLERWVVFLLMESKKTSLVEIPARHILTCYML